MVYEENLSRNTSMKIGLLVTDNDENYGGEEGIRDSLIKRLREVCGPSYIEIVTFFVVNGSFPANKDNFVGFIITGSHFSVNDNLDWICHLEAFIKECYVMPSGPKLVGICFGHQLIAKALGGSVGPNPTEKFIWCSGSVEVTENMSKKPYFQQTFGNNITVHIMQSHYEQVLTKPECAQNAGSAGECEHEFLLYGDKILTMQGHPEVTVEKMANISLPILKKKGKITKEEEEFAMESFKNEDNSNELVKMMLNFIKS